MSNVVDNRVVEMQFDNKQFEQNVSTSMSTLDKLKQKLSFIGATKGFENIDASAKKVNMSKLQQGVEAVQAKFSALEVMGMTALANITNSAVNAGKRIISSLTIAPVQSGLKEYETQINAIQTILANTESKGTTLTQVNSALDELNAYADKTIYNFTEMTRNIGTFTAAGVELDTSVAAIKGIANLAAVSGSSSQQASTAMYQLSQALASGTVKLMDWNSVVNAGMGGQVFQDALKETARVHGIAIDDMIKDEGSFRETLSNGWLSSEILTETLSKFTGDLTDEQLKSMGYTAEQIKEIQKLGQTANDAATKVKTFTQLKDTLSEALGSGWAQTWEILIGDFEEAKELWTQVSDVFGGMINDSSEARNTMLQEWKDLGGRTAILDSIKNTFEALTRIVEPIGEAFSEVFPPMTAQQLLKFSEGLRDITERLKISDKTADNLKRIFKGLFSVIDIGVEAIKSLGRGLGDLIGHFAGTNLGILSLGGSFGDWLSKLRDSVKETGIFNTIIQKIVGFITPAIDKIKEFGAAVKENFNTSGYTGIIGVFKGIIDFAKQVVTAIAGVFGSVSQSIANMLGKGDILQVLNSGIFAGILIAIKKFVGSLDSALGGANGFLKNIKGILDDVRGCFKAYQDQLKAETLLKIAAAIAILVAALYVLSTIDPEALSTALGAITVLFIELIASLAALNKVTSGMKGSTRSSIAMIAMAIAITILASAMKKLADIDPEGIKQGLVAIGILMAELLAFLKTAKMDGKMTGTAIGIVILSVAMLILASAMKSFATMSWEQIGQGLTAIGALLAEIAAFTNLTGNAKHVISTGLSMVLLGAAMKIFASAMKDFAGMQWDEIGRGLAAMAGALAEITIALNLMPKGMMSKGVGLVIVGAALLILASALSTFGGMQWDEIGRGLTVLGIALGELAIALNLMKGTLGGSAAMLVAAIALAIITPVLKILGGMSWEAIAKGLIALAGAFAVIGIAGAILTPVIPAILGLAGAFALIGIGMLAIGGGLALVGIGLASIATGFTALAAAGAAGATAIVSSLSVIVTGFMDLIPTIAQKFGEGLVAFAQVIGEQAPTLAKSFLQMILEVVNAAATYVPAIVGSLVGLLTQVLQELAAHIPELITAGVNFIGAVFDGIIQALNGIDTTNLIKTIVAIGLTAGLMMALSAIVGLIPSAMAGVVGVGIIIAEIALVLAAIGGLAQIPGLEWLIGEGGNLLQTIGTAIGQFVGGIAGGLMSGMSASLPALGENLSAFMTSLEPFLASVSNINADSMSGVKSLAETILILTGADLINKLSSWLTGGSSLAEFGEQLVPFGEAVAAFSEEVKGIEPSAVEAAANAGKIMASMASTIPNSGGLLGEIFGENDLGAFGLQLVAFGAAMALFSAEVDGKINPTAVEAAASAGEIMVALAKEVPNSGGLLGMLMGENDLGSFAGQLVPFGEAIVEFSNAVSKDGGINEEAVAAAGRAGEIMVALAKNVPNSGGLLSLLVGDNSLGSFGSELESFGTSIVAFSNAVSKDGGINEAAVVSAGLAGQIMVALAKNVPSSGGALSLLIGEKSLGSFGTELESFGTSIVAFSNAVSKDGGISVEAVTAAARAGSIMTSLAQEVPSGGGFLDKLFNTPSDLENFAGSLEVYGNAIAAFSTAVSGINSEAIEDAASAGNTLQTLSSTIADDNGTKLENFGMSLNGFADSLNNFGLTLNVEDVASSVESLDTLVRALRLMNSVDTESVAEFKAAIAEIATIDFASATANLQNANGDLMALGVGIIKSIINGMETEASSLATAINTILSSMANGITVQSGALGKIGSSIIKGLSTSITNKSLEVVKALAKVISDSLKIVVTRAKAFTKIGGDLVTKMADGIDKAKTKAKTAVNKVISSSIEKLDHYKTSFNTVGVNLVSGFILGIRSQISRAANAAATMARAALNAANAALDIHSPSREFGKTGKNSALGFINMLLSFGKKVYDAGYDIGNYAKDGLNNALARVSDMISNGTENTPTIRPVLDLSDVQAGVGDMNALFANRPPIGLSASVNSVSTRMRGYNQNGNTTEVVSAIDKLRKDLGNVGGTSYNINGITYDDGSNVADAIRTLVRAATVERRA